MKRISLLSKFGYGTCIVLACAGIFFTPAFGEVEKSEAQESTAPDSMTLKGGEEGTTFKSLRIEGEDRVRIEFDRPTLRIDLEPRNAPGLEWEGIYTALNREELDLVSPYLARSSTERPPHYARPWLNQFTTGTVARFRPAVDKVERWQLAVANSQGKNVANFEGKGKPPKEISWNGLSIDGTPVPPGLTYSYVLEAYDKAGNKRSFVGDGFTLPSYRITTTQGMTMMFTGNEIRTPRNRSLGGNAPAPGIVLEAASWINQRQSAETVRVEVTARTFDDAKHMAEDITTQLRDLVVGNPARVQAVTNVDGQAPDSGTIAITCAMARTETE